MSDPLNRRDGTGDEDVAAKERPNTVRNGPKGARVYDRPKAGGRAMISWVLIAIVVIALLLWLVL